MKRICAIVLVLLLLAVLELPVMAAENEFAPSIGYKDGPEIDKAEIDRTDPEKPDQPKEDAKPCLVITTVIQAQKKETDISQEERDLFLDIYDKMTNNETTLPESYGGWVIRELVDVSWRYTDCVQSNHGKEEWLKEEDNTLTVTLKTGIPVNVEVVVFVYLDGEWVQVENVTHNSDNSLTCEFEDIGPVAICVRENADIPPAQTGDPIGQMLWLWIVLMVVSLGTMTVLVMNRRKFMR